MHTESPKDAVKAALFDRLSHPVMGVFLLALIVSNWQFLIYVIVSDATAEYRIKQACGYFTPTTLFGWPALFTVGYVLLAPILKVLAMMYDRAVTNWEKVRAYKAQIRVIEDKTKAANAELEKVEGMLKAKNAELAQLNTFVSNTQQQLHDMKGALEDIQKFRASAGMNHIFPNLTFPVSASKNPTAHAEIKRRLNAITNIGPRLLTD